METGKDCRYLLSCICMALCIVTAGVTAAAAEPKPAEVRKTDKCAVCGMFVEKYREWIAQVVFADGTAIFFDGPKDMFRYYFSPSRYTPGKKQADIAAIYVTEYYSTKPIDARKALFVTGSDVLGPMGHELIPVDTEAHAKEFMKDHAGKKILKFEAVTTGDVR